MALSRPPHLRISEPHPGLFAYYDGRVPGYSFMPEPNWVDDGAIGLGIATYALVAGEDALIYDTHVSPEHGAAIRAHLEGLGVRQFTVVYSHWHLDHVAGTVAFVGAPVIANERTARHLQEHHLAIEAGTQSGPPAIKPLILPHRTFSGRLEFMLGKRHIVLMEANIHSDDATVLWLPDEAVLLAGDTVEDCVTYVGDPQDLSVHLSELDRLAALHPRTVLPDHGSAEVIAGGGYTPAIIPATQAYIRWLLALKEDPGRAALPLHAVISEELGKGTLHWFAPYEAIHQQNIARVLECFGVRNG
ncbi:MAG: MBL fold metallo-hydrolase [Paracoccaceae bacterium]